MITTELGLTISHWQGHIKYQQARDYRVKFAMIKATQGVWFTDNRFSVNWEGFRSVGIRRGSFHWYEPWGDPVEQARQYLSVCPSPGELGHVLDLEDEYRVPQDYAERVKVCLDYIQGETGRKPRIYTAYYYWLKYLSKADYADDYKLWIANYNDRVPIVPRPWRPFGWWIWQYTGKGDGKKYGCDSYHVPLEVYNGRLKYLPV